MASCFLAPFTSDLCTKFSVWSIVKKGRDIKLEWILTSVVCIFIDVVWRSHIQPNFGFSNGYLFQNLLFHYHLPDYVSSEGMTSSAWCALVKYILGSDRKHNSCLADGIAQMLSLLMLRKFARNFLCTYFVSIIYIALWLQKFK